MPATGDGPAQKKRLWRNLFRRRGSVNFKAWYIGIIFSLIAGFAAYWVNQFQFIQSVEAKTLDMRFTRFQIPERADTSIIMVAIDNNSLDYFAANGQSYPWPRSFYALITNYFKEDGAGPILFDMLFYQPDGDFAESDAEQTDGSFAQAIQANGRVILGAELTLDTATVNAQFSETRYRIVPPDMAKFGLKLKSGWIPDFPRFRSIKAPIDTLRHKIRGLGITNIMTDPDGIFRRVPLAYKLGQNYLPILALSGWLSEQPGAVVKTVNGSLQVGVRAIPIDPEGRYLLNWYGPGGSKGVFKYITFSSVIQSASALRYGGVASLPPRYFKGKTIIVGAEASGLKDLKPTPFSSLGDYPGMEIWATLLSNLRNNDFITIVPDYLNVMNTILVTLLAFWAFSRLPPKLSYPGLFFVLVYIIALAAYLWWAERILVNVTMPVTGFIFAYAFIFFNEQKDKLFLKKAFGTYISPELINVMYQNHEEPQLGGETINGTPLFTDIQRFSSFSELVSAQDLVALLNEYLTKMTDILLSEGGTLDKYEGDAIIAFFGAPVRLPDHAVRAARTAVRMQKGLSELREKWRQEKGRWPDVVSQMRMRIGLSSGEMVTGNMGSKTRMNYTMMGDTVNTAARLESSAKAYGVYTQISHHTAALLGEEFAMRELGTTRVFGKKEALTTFEILDYTKDLSDADRELLALWPQGLAAVKNQTWTIAIKIFEQTLAFERQFEGRPTNPSRVYLEERIPYWRAHPPGKNWDGIWALSSK
ncbi:MAG: hypothetical protein CO167_03745 [Candidatus Marinimicrobia bacterium CG_4_9_14_3_um_filter_48_9]|nr:MAG: hypothetical protein CO167_03745 [Candidatus Marinimicrobia bacterium CG_4_9_14_3_um_filter_48_9]